MFFLYALNDKIKDLTPYDPVEERGQIHLDANESFLPPPPELLEEFSEIAAGLGYNRYPDPAAGKVCRAFADYYRVPAENVAAGNGSDELITLLFSGFLQKGQAFATLEPDFSMYAFNGAIQEARHVAIGKRSDYTLDVDEVIAVCGREKVKLLIFSNPCNPTSLVVKREEIRRLVRGVEALVVLDEAYMDFSDQSMLGEFLEYENLVILRTCSKALGMAAVRLGFAVANQRVITALRSVKAPYNVNALTQAFGAAVLGKPGLLRVALKTILDSKEQLAREVKRIGEAFPGKFSLLPGETNFLALVLEGPEKLYRYLEERNISVRLTGGLLRVTCGAPEENEAFLKAFRAYWERG